MFSFSRTTSLPVLDEIYAIFKSRFRWVLVAHIDKCDFSKKELANRLNVHPSEISHWVNGSRFPDMTALYALIKTFKLDDKDRKELVGLWHLSLLADHLKEYYEKALEDKDESAARQIFVDMLHQNWGDLYYKEWLEWYLSVVQPVGKPAGNNP